MLKVPTELLFRVLFFTALIVGLLLAMSLGAVALRWARNLPNAGDETHKPIDYWRNEVLDRKRVEHERLHGPLESEGKPRPDQFRPPPPLTEAEKNRREK